MRIRNSRKKKTGSDWKRFAPNSYINIKDIWQGVEKGADADGRKTGAAGKK